MFYGECEEPENDSAINMMTVLMDNDACDDAADGDDDALGAH